MITRTRKISILDVDIDSNVKEREVALGCELWLDNTIAGHLYPNLKMALVSVPTEILELHEKAVVSEVCARELLLRLRDADHEFL